MTPTDPEAALLRAVLDAPDDDLPRLAYADLLEERGEDARAEFVRVQLARARPCPMGYSDAYHVDDDCPPCDGLFRREQELLEGWALYWLEGLTRQVDISRCEYHQETGRVVEFGGAIVSTAHFCRGFVARVAVPTDDFLAHAKKLFSRHPITEVVLADREPYPNGSGQVWFDAGRTGKSLAVPASAELPTSLYPLLTRWEPDYGNGRWRAYPDKATALADLSRACVAFGRAAAGLGELREGARR